MEDEEEWNTPEPAEQDDDLSTPEVTGGSSGTDGRPRTWDQLLAQAGSWVVTRKDQGGYCGKYCKLCNAWVDYSHLASDRHQKRIWWHPPHPPRQDETSPRETRPASSSSAAAGVSSSAGEPPLAQLPEAALRRSAWKLYLEPDTDRRWFWNEVTEEHFYCDNAAPWSRYCASRDGGCYYWWHNETTDDWFEDKYSIPGPMNVVAVTTSS